MHLSTKDPHDDDALEAAVRDALNHCPGLHAADIDIDVLQNDDSS